MCQSIGLPPSSAIGAGTDAGFFAQAGAEATGKDYSFQSDDLLAVRSESD